MAEFGVEKERGQLLRLAKAQGCEVRKGSHSIVIIGPDGRLVGNTPASKSGPGATVGLRSKMRRAGLVVDSDEWNQKSSEERRESAMTATAAANASIKQEQQPEPQPETDGVMTTDEFTCEECGQSFDKFTSFRAHLGSHARTVTSPMGDRVLAEINEHPGLHPREYAERLGIDQRNISGVAARLRRMGQIRVEGNRQAARYYPIAVRETQQIPGTDDNAALPRATRATMQTNGTPSASPVRTRRVLPDDAVGRLRLVTELLPSDISELLARFDAQEAELLTLRAFKQRVEKKLGDILDAL